MSIKSRVLFYLYNRLFKAYVEESIANGLRSQSVEQLFLDIAYSVVYNQVPGDYLEFGVYGGDSFSKLYHYIEMFWKNYQLHMLSIRVAFESDYFSRMRFFAFDSFEGLPGSSEEDTPVHYRKQGVYMKSKEYFLANLKEKEVDTSKVVVVPGWFDATLKEETKVLHQLEKASLIFIDCDLYESAVPVFNFITSLLQNGTVIVIDDYFRYKGMPTQGIQRAFKEWLALNPSWGVSELARCSANRVAFICYQTHS